MKKICSVVLAAVLLIFTVVPAFAAISPSASVEYDVVIENTGGGKGSYTVGNVDGEKQVVLTATAKDGYTFSHWVIDGKYSILEGSLNSKVLTVVLRSDIVATPYFVKNGDKEPGTSATVKQNQGSTSPKTGDFNPYCVVVLAILFAALFSVMGAKKAITKSKK